MTYYKYYLCVVQINEECFSFFLIGQRNLKSKVYSIKENYFMKKHVGDFLGNFEKHETL